MITEAIYGDDDPALMLARLQRELVELKGRQLVGSDSFQSYGTSSDGTWDFSATLIQNGRARFRIRYDFDRANGGAISRINAYYRINNPDVMGNPMPRRTSTNPNIDVKWTKTADEPTYAEWELVVANTSAVPATYTGYVKLFITATASGVFSIHAI